MTGARLVTRTSSATPELEITTAAEFSESSSWGQSNYTDFTRKDPEGTP
jgi:hypothetical protein